MDKYIIPSAIFILIISIIYPLFPLLLLGIVFAMLLIDLYYWKTPPKPYLSLDLETNLKMNWLFKGHRQTWLEVSETLSFTTIIKFHPEIVKNEYTAEFSVARVIIKELEIGKKYFYRIQCSEKGAKQKSIFQGKKNWFIVPKKEYKDEGLRFAILGDLQPTKYIPPFIQMRIFNQIKKEKVDFVVNLGDHTMEGVDPIIWRYYLHVIGRVAKNIPIIGIPGNHDTMLKRKNGNVHINDVYSTYVNYPKSDGCYGIHLYGIHFIALIFGTSYSIDSEQFKWVQEHLKARNKDEWLITLWHSSPYNSVKSNAHTEEIRVNIEPLIRENGGKLWFGGHEHSYQRYYKDGVNFVTTGATSSFHRHFVSMEYKQEIILKFHHCVVDVTKDDLKLKAISLTGKKITGLEKSAS